jgi:hypothetical protein
VFTDPAVQRLWDAGRILAAYEASSEPVAASSAHPFRDQLQLLTDAQQWHERGVLCWYNARNAEARAALARAYELRIKILGPEHPDTLDTAERQAAAARSIPEREAVLERLIAVFGDQDLRVAIARRNLAALLRDEHQLSEARATLALAAPIIERSLPRDHPDVIALLKVDALLSSCEESYDTAMARATAAIERGQRAWTPEHPFVTSVELTILHIELATGRYKSAHRRSPSVCRRLEAAYGEHPLVAIALWLGALVDLRGEYGLLQAPADLARAIGIQQQRKRDASDMERTLLEVLRRSGLRREAEELAAKIRDT